MTGLQGGDLEPQPDPASPGTAASRKRLPPRWQLLAFTASTPDEQLVAAYDRLRAQIASLRKPRRDSQERAAGTALAEHLAADAARILHQLCEQVGDGGSPELALTDLLPAQERPDEHHDRHAQQDAARDIVMDGEEPDRAAERDKRQQERQ